MARFQILLSTEIENKDRYRKPAKLMNTYNISLNVAILNIIHNLFCFHKKIRVICLKLTVND